MNLLNNYKLLQWNRSFKVFFSFLSDYSPENVAAVSIEQGERLYKMLTKQNTGQDIKEFVVTNCSKERSGSIVTKTLKS